ncbi:hypothetical protein C1645_751055 [Glomus cerebriforme]|uniref:NADAR domain-containing protein n=1 Tax=Glomus cerebriforme TaxID=658196 RepID=A0A397TIT0_9GLOM|nr:hypothetical protein C1645_751055 [Glomus cerebriforme]
MQNQHHNQLQQQQRQQGPQPSPTSFRSEEQQIQYRRCIENPCEYMVKDEHDPETYAPRFELNSQGNPVTNEVRNDDLDVSIYMNMNHMMNHQIQPPLSPSVREQPPPNTIWFYNRNEPYYEFTNFKEGFPIKAAIREPYPGSLPDVKSWATSEHLFQAAKFKNTTPEIADKIRMCRTARDALNTARKYQQYVDPSWQSINVQVMEWVVKSKFEQHPILAKRLLGTGDQILVEHTEVDRFWGDGGDGSGRNMLGEVLMHVRQYLRDTRKNNNGENNSLKGSTEGNSIYSMSDPSSSSISSLQTPHMYPGNGNGRRSKQGQGASSPIPSSPPPPLPPRRTEKRNKQHFQQLQQHPQQHQQQQQIQQLQIQQQQQEVATLYHMGQVYISPQVDGGTTYYCPPPYSEHPNM